MCMAWVFNKGKTITLINHEEVARDELNNPVYNDIETQVDNVLWSTSLTDDIINSTNLNGRKEVLILAIPKGDTHKWEDQHVIIEGKKYHIFTPAKKGIDELVPSPWNCQYLCERYE